MKSAVIWPELEAAISAWYRGEATHEQLELGATELPRILADGTALDFSEGEFTQYMMVAAGMASDLRAEEAAKRLRDEGLQ